MNCVSPAARPPHGLPAPPPELLAHGERVLDHLRRRIEEAGGALDFADFMREALYAPGLGYYAAGLPKFGAAGDFITAPEVSPLFGRTLSRQLAEVLAQVEGSLLEFGAGSGALAAKLLLELERLGRLPARYLILDVSASLREVQRERIGRAAPHLLERVEWLDAWPQGFTGVMLGNEVLDALPVRLLEIGADGPQRLAVSFGEAGLAWARLPASEKDRAVLAQIEAARGGPFPQGYRVEFHPELEGWVAGLAHTLHEGVALLFDYGGSARELYAAERWMGSLRCHLRHHAHDDPLLYPGLQDITAWVDFSRLAACAAQAGLDVLGYTTQAHFLLGCGLAQVYEQAFAQAEGAADQLRLAQGFKTLMMPGEMGERFKAIALGRGVEGLAGFSMRDFRDRL